MSSAAAAQSAPVYLTREGGVFRLAFPYDKELVQRMRALPYATFDGQTKSWTCMVCTDSVEQLRRLWYDGLVDVAVDDLVAPDEDLPEVREAMLRAGSGKRPFVVHMATRDDRLYSRLTSIPGAQWDKSAQAISYPPQAAAALNELVERGVVSDENDLLKPADVVVTFDGRTGRFKVMGDKRAQPVFDRHFPHKDVVEVWRNADNPIDVDFSDAFTKEIYEGERARISDGVQPASMTIPLYDYQAKDVAFVTARTGSGVLHQPGAGKTAVALGAGCELLDRGEVERVVFVCPSSIRTQVGKEIVRFTRFTEDDVVVIGGSLKKRKEAYKRAKDAAWVVVHYDVLSRDFDKLKPLCAGAFMVFDEAHKCFPAGTMIDTETGPVDIVDVRAEDQVWSWDEDTETFILRPVTATMTSDSTSRLLRVVTSGGAVTCTEDHPLAVVPDGPRTADGWVEAGELLPGDVLRRRAPDGWLADPVEQVELVSTTAGEVHNLEVDGTHSYVADGVLVHNCKNPQAKRTKSAKDLAKVSARRVVMTGTPVENDPGEWYSILGQLGVPGSLGTYHEFYNRYQYPGRFGGFEGARNIPELRQRSSVHYTRRLKSEIAEHLPPLRVQRVVLDPDPKYAAALRRAHREARDAIAKDRVEQARHSAGPLFDGDERPGAEAGMTADKRSEIEAGAEMTAVGMLRAMCSSPRLLQMSDSVAAEVLDEAGLIVDADGPKLDELRSLATELRWTRQQRLERMDAAGRTSATCDEVTGERMVVFTYSRKMADLIAERLREDGVAHRTYHGETSQADRDEAAEMFVDPDADITVLVCTDAAAEGLNLGRCCNLLVNFDVPWNPSTLIQRGNRIHRVDGTASTYLVLNYTVAGTIENGILRMLERKADLSDAILGESGGRAATTGRNTGVPNIGEILAEAFDEVADDRDADGRKVA